MIQTLIKHHIFRFFLISLLILVPAVVTGWVLNARSSFLLVIIYVVTLQIVSFLSSRGPEGVWRKFSSFTSILLLFFGGIALITYIIIIPFSAYQIWFHLLDTGKMRGVISRVFVLFLTYSSCLVFINVHRKKILPSFFLYGSVLCFTFFMIYRFLPLLLLFFVMLFTTVLINFRWGDLSAGRKRGITVFLMLLLFSSGLTSVLSLLPDAQGSAFVGGRLSPGLRRAVLRVFPKFPVLAGIPGYGLSMPVKDLTVRPSLSEYPLFELDMEPGSRHYLRTVIYDNYNEKGWHSSTKPSENPGITFLLLADRLPDLYQKIHIRVMIDFYPYIPHTLKTSLVSSSQSLDIGIGDINTGYVAAVPLLYDQKLVLYEAIDHSFETSIVLEPEILDAYLSVPKEIDSSIVQLGEKLATGDLADKLSSIGEYLSDGFIYDLEVPSIRGGKDILSRFLFYDKRGYCVHFATSFVILARIAGIPARYATGFLVSSSASYKYPMEEGIRVVTGLNAHAWAEIWVPDKGWITWEATPPMIPENQGSSGFWEDLISGDSAFTRRQVQAVTGILYDSEDTKSPVMSILLATLTAGGIAVLVIFLVKKRPRTAQSKGRFFKHTRRFGRRITRRTGKLGILHPSVGGWTRWERETGKILSVETSMFKEIFFARRNPGRSEIEAMKKLLRSLRKLK